MADDGDGRVGGLGGSGTGTPLGLGALVERIETGARQRCRYLVGLVGPPGSGKSTLAEHLAETLGGVVVPMDGFHLDNTELAELGLFEVKGAPETFDADAFVRLVEQLRHADGPVTAPSFDRVGDHTVADTIRVEPDDRIVIVEGNYLLVDRPPWTTLRELFDLTGYLVVDDRTRAERLVARHVQHGRSAHDAHEFVRNSDEANAVIVAATRSRADLTIDPSLP